MASNHSPNIGKISDAISRAANSKAIPVDVSPRLLVLPERGYRNRNWNSHISRLEVAGITVKSPSSDKGIDLSNG